jgi:tetratricopeptide (TPR) repeat protein
VTARTSSFHFRGKDTTIADIGRALDVATVLEGSVRKAGNRVRISVQLVRVSDSSHLWSESYDRTLDDIFAVQDDIAQSVVKELRTTLLGEEADSDASGQAKAEVAQAAKGRGTDPEAHRLYLLARHLIDRVNREDMEKAVELLQQALALDPQFAAAWAELAWVYAVQAGWAWVPFAEGYERARETVNRALALEPDLSEGHSRMGWIHMYYDWDFPGAEASFARALLSSPRNADALRGAGFLAWTLGQLERSIDLFRRALECDPLSANGYTYLGTSLHDLGRFEESEVAYRKALEVAPKTVQTRAYFSLTLLELGRGEEAREEARREPYEVFRLFAVAIVEHALGHATESDQALAGLIENYPVDSGYQIAEIHAARGHADEAFRWLEHSHAHRDPASPSF